MRITRPINSQPPAAGLATLAVVGGVSRLSGVNGFSAVFLVGIARGRF